MSKMTRAGGSLMTLLLGLGFGVALSTAANAELVTGGWLDKPKVQPTPPPQAAEPGPPPADVVPIVRPRPMARPRPAPQQRAPGNAPPADGSVRF